MEIAEVGTRSIAIATDAAGTVPTNNTGHTVPVGTDFLLALIAFEGNEAINPTTGCQWLGVDLTEIDDTGSTGDNSDCRIYAYGMVSPTAGSGNARTAYQYSGAPAVSVWMNFTGTATASVAAATNAISNVSNTSPASTSVLASGGTAGNTLIAFGAAQNSGLSPASINGSFSELLDTTTASGTAEFAYYLATYYAISGAEGPTITWASSNENAAVLVELVAAGITSLPGYHGANRGIIRGTGRGVG
jgi:hypothetical protein